MAWVGLAQSTTTCPSHRVGAHSHSCRDERYRIVGDRHPTATPWDHRRPHPRPRPV